MSQIRIKTNSTEQIIATITLLKVLQTGLSDVLLKIHRASDDFVYDFNDDTFKASGWTSATQAMTEIDATNLPGQYKYDFDTSAITNAVTDDTYYFIMTCASADNIPQSGEIKVGQFIDDIDAPISSMATEVNATTNKNEVIAEVDANETKIDAIQADITTSAAKLDLIGVLVGKNRRIKNAVHNPLTGNLESATIFGYASAADATNDVNPIITITVTGTELDSFQTGLLEVQS